MQDEKKVYGFTLSLFEYIETIPTLWDTVKGMSKPEADTKILDANRRYSQNSSRKTRSISLKTMLCNSSVTTEERVTTDVTSGPTLKSVCFLKRAAISC